MGNANTIIGAKTKPIPVPEKEIGIDTKNVLQKEILDAVESSTLDVGALESFSNTAQTRENIYALIDTMSQDDSIASILETYTEDVVATNDSGNIVWCESDNPDIQKYVTYILDSIRVDKYAYEWVYSLLKYGDLYLRMYRKSDIEKKDALQDTKEKDTSYSALRKSELNESNILNEDVKVMIDAKNDPYVYYVEAVANPGEMFELTQFGKTAGYIKAPVTIQRNYDANDILNNYFKYKMRRNDVSVYSAVDFVHACLQSSTSRTKEEVEIFLNDKNLETDTPDATYSVRKGQSLLYNSFKIWRELDLLENSVLLNRLTKSAIIRILNVDVGDMPKERVRTFLDQLKQKIEQKSAIDTDVSLTEYTNPGPIENILYVPVHGTQGTINAQTLGGDVDVRSLIDIEYFQNKLYGSFRVPKQFFALTSDSTGFNGGTSLSIISARYGKAIKRIQSVFTQFLTDLVHLFLLDKGLESYINKFTLRMQEPVTQEELDKRENMRNRIAVIGDVMNQVSNVTDNELTKLKIVKTLLADSGTNPEVVALLQEEVDRLEEETANGEKPEETKPEGPEDNFDTGYIPNESSVAPMDFEEPSEETMNEPSGEEFIEPTEDSYLPSGEELNIDLTNNTEF